MSKKALVIGGAGFIGSHLTDVLVQNNYPVCVYDNFSTGKRSFLPNSPLISIVEGDILNPSLLKQTINDFQPDICYHLAAVHFIPACENNPENAFRVNVEGTQAVLSACKNKVENFVFASTGAIYDPDYTDPLSENSPISAKDIYGITKWTCEKMIEYYTSKEFGQAIIARLFNAVGRRETNPHLIPAIMEQLSLGIRRIELGNLYPKRDYIHVEDIADALFALLLTTNKNSYEVYNIGSGIEHSVDRLVETCEEVLGEPIVIESVASRRRKYDRPNQLANISKMKASTGWCPSRTLKQALAEVWSEEKTKRITI